MRGKALSMEIIHKPTATVGQIVKDLELIVAKSPDIYMEYRNDNYNAMFVKGIKLRKDIAIFETTGKRYRAATLEEILAMLKMLNTSVGVVMQDGWELLDFHPNADGSILRYDDEEDYCLFLLDRNVQLLTTQQMEAELKEKYGEEVLSCKVAMVDKKRRKACLMNSLQWIGGKLCLCHDEDEEKDSITVAELLEGFPTCAEFMVVLVSRYHTVEVGENGIFFDFKKGDEKYLGLFFGEVLYDSKEELEILI